MNGFSNYKNNIAKLVSSLRQALCLMVLTAFSLTANAQYSYEVVLPPGALSAQTFGINNAGKVTGGADDGVELFTFIYDMKKGTYEAIGADMGVLDISNSGVMVGDIDGVCAIREKNGTIMTLFPPSFAVDSFCQVRGVNANDKVSGFEVDAMGGWLGFTYDPKKDTYEEFLPSTQTFAHAINAQGQVAGSVALDADAAFLGSAAGRYGFVRQMDGSVKHFAIAQSFAGQTRARGISESGLVAGFYLDPDTFELKSYVTNLTSGTEFEEITLNDNQVVHQRPCNPNLPPPPGPGYDLFTNMTASQVRNDGVVVGSCTDIYFNATTIDSVFYSAGFLASPIK